MKIDNNLGYLMNRTALKIKLTAQRRFNAQGYPLTTEHWGILQKLYESDCLPQVTLATLLNKDKPNITRIVDVMEKNNLVKRTPDPGDRRKYLICLTSYSRKIKDELFAIAMDINKKAYEGLSPSDLNIFKNMLNQIYMNLDD